MGGGFGEALRAAHTQAGGDHAGVKLIAIEGFGGSLTTALNDIDGLAHH